MRTYLKLALSLVAMFFLGRPAAGQGIVNPAITGNLVTAQIQLPGNIGADLTLSFSQVGGLDLATLGLSAELVDPSSPSLIGRLPAGSLVSISTGFPVRVCVRPVTSGTLAFRGTYVLALHTENLAYMPRTPLRLFHANDGGMFKDISDGMGAGSYRVRGTGGSFSEFLITADLRSVDAVILQKFDDLQSCLDSNAGAISASVLSSLRGLLLQARTANTAGDPIGAAQNIQTFLDLVGQHSGTGIPDLWSVGDPAVNVAGELRSRGSTLVFSLNLKSS